MDNVTHSLIGLAAGEAAFQYRYRNELEKRSLPSGKILRGCFWFASWAANNFPDIDVFYTSITGGKIGNLLHHRGHTHSFMMGFVEAFFVLLLTYVLAAHYKNSNLISKRSWFSVYIVSWIGIGLHIFADFWNSYGVHPLWPFYNGWLYGDTIFIIEPLIWAIFIPAVFNLKSGVKKIDILLRFIFGVALVGISIVMLKTNYVPIGFMFCFCVLIFYFYKKFSEMKQGKIAFSALKSLAVLLLIFFAASVQARKVVKEMIPNTDDIALTPLPMNLFCWAYVARYIDHKADQDFVIHEGMISILPNLYALDRCRKEPESGTTALKAGEYRTSLKEFKRIANEDCEVAAILKFLRMPFFVQDGENQIIVGDVRYDRDYGLGFSELRIKLNKTKVCPKFIPNWIAPVNFKDMN